MTGISGAAVARAADAMLRTLGGSDAILLFPAAGLPPDPESALGLIDPGVVQAVIGPVLVRDLPAESSGPRRHIELLVSPAAVAEQVSQRNVASADVLFETALGIVYAGEIFHIEGFVIERIEALPYLYRVSAIT